MNGKLAKKIRKEVNQKVRQDVNDVFKIIAAENILRRIGYAFKIIFKYNLPDGRQDLGEALEVKHG